MAKNDLTTEEEENLRVSISRFSDWLYKKKIIQAKLEVAKVIELPSANEDWSMIYNPSTKSVSFNTFVRRKCSFNYFKSIALHEFFHLYVQRVPNKSDATKIKDDFGEIFMKLIDIEADFFTALYYKEVEGFSLVDYLKLYFEGNQVFSDKWIRVGKLERFIGTLLGIFKLHTTPGSETKIWDLYLPSLTPLYTDDQLHVLVIRKEHIYFDQIFVTYQDLVDLKQCYTNIDTLTLKGYVEGLVKFCCKAFKVEQTAKLREDIQKLNHGQ